MAHEILSVKLCELDEQLARLQGRIHLSELEEPPRLRQEIEALRRENTEAALTLQARLRHSRAGIVAVLAEAYGAVEQRVEAAMDALAAQAAGCCDSKAAAEGKILLAEYALDFALQAANRALLLALEAIDAQGTALEQERSPL